MIRESQECVELLLKGLLRHLGIEAPKTPDVSSVLKMYQGKLSQLIRTNLNIIVATSRSLRKERELAFYGSEDWIPTEKYSEADSLEAIAKVEQIFHWVQQVLG